MSKYLSQIKLLVKSTKRALALVTPYFKFKKKNFERLIVVAGVIFLISLRLFLSVNGLLVEIVDEVNKDPLEAYTLTAIVKDIFPYFLGFLPEFINALVLAGLEYIAQSLKNSLRFDYTAEWSALKSGNVEDIMHITHRIKHLIDAFANLVLEAPWNVFSLVDCLYRLSLVSGGSGLILYIGLFVLISTGITLLLTNAMLAHSKEMIKLNAKISSEMKVVETHKDSIDNMNSYQWHLDKIEYLAKEKNQGLLYKFGLGSSLNSFMALTYWMSNAYMRVLQKIGFAGLKEDINKMLFFSSTFTFLALFKNISTGYGDLFKGDINGVYDWKESMAKHRALLQHENAFRLIKDNFDDSKGNNALVLSAFRVYLPAERNNGLERTFVRDANFTFAKGLCYQFTGHNGLGKTKILSAIAGGWWYAEGKGTLAANADVKSSIVYIPSNPIINEGTLIEIIAYPYPVTGDKQAKLEHYMQEFGLSKFIPLLHKTKDEGDKTMSSWKGLSSGEKQKIVLLSLLYKNPTVLLLDEVMSNLDLTVKAAIKKYLKQEFPAAAIICVEHADSLSREPIDLQDRNPEKFYDIEFTIGSDQRLICK